MNQPNLPRVPDGPPSGLRPPRPRARSGALLAAALGLFSCAVQGDAPERDPGRVTLHRLNRTEYNNPVRDLLGTALRPADAFPFDDVGHGFDNIADVLSLSPLQVELYQRAAEQIV